MQNAFEQFVDVQSRRQFLTGTSIGLGAAALSNAAPPAALATGLHHPARAKRVIFLFMAGAPSQLELFDYKPGLEKLHGSKLPDSVSQGQRVTAMPLGQEQIVCSSAFKFARHGKSGTYMSELLPHLSTVTDDLCLIKSTSTGAINHDPAKTYFH
jgi:hypothetical protein